MSILGRIRRLFGVKTQIPQPEDDGFRPSTYSEGYGTNGNSHEAGGPVFSPADEKVLDEAMGLKPRCESRLRQRAGSGGNRSWRCTLDAGHSRMHLNGAGGRRW